MIRHTLKNIFPGRVNEKRRIWHRDQAGRFFVQLENSMCDNCQMIAQKISDEKLQRLPHPAYSPDLSPCYFWLFGMLKGNIKDHAFQIVEEILEAVPIDLEWSDIRKAPKRLLQLDGAS
jgi:hypothetical protein